MSFKIISTDTKAIPIPLKLIQDFKEEIDILCYHMKMMHTEQVIKDTRFQNKRLHCNN